VVPVGRLEQRDQRTGVKRTSGAFAE
jgi:hypothetical protein